MDVWVDSRSDDGQNLNPSVGETAVSFFLARAGKVKSYIVLASKVACICGILNAKEYGDVSPEGLTFIPRDTTSPWLLISNEVSNTTSLYEVAISD